MRTLYLVVLSFLCLGNATAQSSLMYYPFSGIKVYAYGAEQTLPWCGGFNNSQFSMGDLNNDGLQDLIVFTKGIGVQTFLNEGSAAAPKYVFAPGYANNFPPCVDYLIMVDYNHDNIPDLFQQGVTGIAAYRGYYNSSNQLCFNFYMELFYNNDLDAGGSANAFNNPGDIPAIVDVDGDGDIDFVSYDILGGYMNYYRNMQVEMGLPADSIHIDLKDRCWGKVYQGFWRSHTLGTHCDNSALLRAHADTARRVTHSGNTPCLFDWDMDGDYDYLDGSISFNEMTFLKNGRVEYGGNDSMVSQDTLWQTTGTTIELPTWPAAFNIDIDQDGKKDLLIAPNGNSPGLMPENYNCVWYYKNYSTAGHPDWRFVSDSFLVDQSIDAGAAGYPMLFDYNKDGKPDLFLGSDGYYQHSTGLLRSGLSYYLNTSTPGNPSFTLQTKDFLNIDSFGFVGTAPAFGDVDNDGKSDMIIGHTDGSLSYFKNIAASDSVAPVWQSMGVLQDETGTAINVDGYAAPFVYDIDKDGLKDLVIGNIYGTLVYYRNVSTSPGVIKLQLINSSLGLARTDPTQIISCNSTPFIGQIDTTGKDYLLMGSNSGNLYLFDSVASGDTTAVYPMITGTYSYIDSAGNGYNDYGSAYAAFWNLRSAPTIGDIAGDGGKEMLVGDARGGIRLYKLNARNTEAVHNQVEAGRVTIYPNPVSEQLNVTWSGMLQKNVTVSITNMQGESLYSSTFTASVEHSVISVSSLTSGLYICVIQSGDNKYYSKFTVLHH